MGQRSSRVFVSDLYEIPEAIIHESHSRAFSQFLQNWFGNSWALTRGEVDLGFLNDLTSEEREIAKDLLRRNLKLKYTHLIEGLAALGDLTSVPMLRAMLASESDSSRQLTIAGALWKLNRDAAFVDCLERMKSSNHASLKQAHFYQILWLGDERAIDFLIELLNDPDRFVRFLAISTLNELEFERRFLVPETQLPRGSEHYRSHGSDANFRAMMAAHLQTRNAAITNGR
jgi:hypothetical protein